MTAKLNDRRRATRVPVLLSVHYETVASSEGAQTVDVSRSGLFLGTKDPLPVGTHLELRIGETSKVKVRVARVVEPDVGGQRTPGMGCAILEADDAATIAIAKELARTPAREVKVVLDGAWPAPVPLARRTRDARNGAAFASKPSGAATDHATAAESTEAATAVQAGGGDKRSKKDKKRQKGGKTDLFSEKPE